MTPPASKNILLCTLGTSWAVIPEIFGWLAPNVLNLYAHHPNRAALDTLRAEHRLQPPDELWICTTEGLQTRASLAQLHTWWQQLGAPLPLSIWTAAGTDHRSAFTAALLLHASDAHLRHKLYQRIFGQLSARSIPE